MSEFYVRNRQRSRPIDLQLLKSIALALGGKICATEYRIGILLVGAREITRLNEAFLKHAGPTDVIAFGYAATPSRTVHGEIFICVDEALRQARQFRTSWQKEVVRYLAHGLLHLQGYDDLTAAKRVRMKAVENRLLRGVEREFCLSQLGRRPTVRA